MLGWHMAPTGMMALAVPGATAAAGCPAEPRTLPINNSQLRSVVTRSGVAITASPGAGGTTSLGCAGGAPVSPGLTERGQEHTHPVLCGDLGLINLLSSREVGMVPEEAGETIVLE